MIELGKQYDCHTCTAACCRRGVTMPLHADEVQFMEAGGTGLREVQPPQVPGRRPVKFLPLLTVRTPGAPGRYELQTDCSYLDNNPSTAGQHCSAYDDSRRPEICEDFAPGSFRCREVRVLAGVDEPGEFAIYLLETAGG